MASVWKKAARKEKRAAFSLEQGTHADIEWRLCPSRMSVV
jgi:hypothetical protein